LNLVHARNVRSSVEQDNEFSSAYATGSKTFVARVKVSVCVLQVNLHSGVTRGLTQGRQSLAEGGPLAKTQEKVKK